MSELSRLSHAFYKAELIKCSYELRDGKVISNKQFERIIEKILDRYGE